MVVQKTTNQIVNVPILTKNVIPDLYGVSYPSARPMHIYRKQGVSNALNTSRPFTSACEPCSTSTIVGVPFKMIGKQDNGMLKTTCCIPRIRASKLKVSPTYYSNYNAYLKNRGNTFHEKSNFHRIPEVDYSLQPDNQLPDSSCFRVNGVTDIPSCKLTIYKPNNPGFSTEGSVESSTYVDRLKYNAITTNNASFNKTFHFKLGYSTDPVYFVKNKMALQCYAGRCR